MKSTCEKCGAELVTGSLVTPQGLMFYPEGEDKKLKPKRSLVICDACPECGAVTNIRLKNPEMVR